MEIPHSSCIRGIHLEFQGEVEESYTAETGMDSDKTED
jgi:hypothetical protein